MATGYAMYNGSLDIQGYAVLLHNADERPILDINDVFAIACSDPNHFATFNLSDGSLTVLSQSISEAGANINYKINVTTGKPRTETISFDIQNITDMPITGGTFNYTVTPSNTSVIDGTITADMPQIIDPHSIRNFKNKYTS